jgi:hypothetical protein
MEGHMSYKVIYCHSSTETGIFIVELYEHISIGHSYIDRA